MIIRFRSRQYVCVLIASGIALAGCKKKEPPAPPPPEVQVITAAAKDVPIFKEWIGTLDGSENTEIRARVSGYLLKRNYKEGSLVKKGDLLFEIDPRTSEAELLQAKSNLAEGKAQQAADQAESDRSTELFKKKVISEKEYIQNTQANAASVEKVASLAAMAQQAEINLAYCKVVSPVDGIAGNSKAQVGDLVGSADNTVLTQISTLDPIKIKFPVSESQYLEGIKREQETLDLPLEQRPARLEVILADGTVYPEKAKLFSVERQVEEGAGTILITAIMSNAKNILRPGFFAKTRLEADVIKNAVVIPQRALQEVQGMYLLGVVTAEGKAEVRPVKTGAKMGSDIVVASGLKVGETVIVEGMQKAKNGAPVSAKPWTPQPPPGGAPAPGAPPATDQPADPAAAPKPEAAK